MALNKYILQVRIGKDAELKESNGRKFAQSSGAHTETWKDKNNEKKQRTQWFNLVIFGPQAESFAKYVTKGKEVIIEGKMVSNEYEKDGTKNTSWSFQIDSFHFTSGSPNTSGSNSNTGDENSASPPTGSSTSSFDDDIPF